MSPAILARLARRFRRSDSGLAAVEFALTAPFLGLLLLGGVDLARLLLIRGQVDQVGFSVSDVTAQYQAGTMNKDALNQVFRITGKTLSSYVSGATGVTILTSVYLDNTTPKVRWQCYSTSGTAWKSKVGAAGAVAIIDKSLLADTNDNVIVSEVFYKYTPLFFKFLENQKFTFVDKNGFDMYAMSIFRPRLGSLNTTPCP